MSHPIHYLYAAKLWNGRIRPEILRMAGLRNRICSTVYRDIRGEDPEAAGSVSRISDGMVDSILQSRQAVQPDDPFVEMIGGQSVIGGFRYNVHINEIGRKDNLTTILLTVRQQDKTP